MKQLAIFRLDDPFADQKIKIDEPTPILLTDQHYRHRPYFPCLDQSQCLEQLIKRAISAWKRDQRPRAFEEMELAQSKIMEAETQRRRDVGVRELLVRQFNVQAYRRSVGIKAPRLAASMIPGRRP